MRLKDIIDCLRYHGHPIPHDYNVGDFIKEMMEIKDKNIVSLEISDCGCEKLS